MSYIFLDAMKVDRFYAKSSRYLSNELNKIKDLHLKYDDFQKVYDIESKERDLTYYLNALEKRPTWLRVVLAFVLGISFMQLSSAIYVAFDQGYLSSRQVNILVISFLLVLVSLGILIFEYKKFQDNKFRALKLFLTVKHHNHQAIIEERNSKLNPRPKYKKGSPMDYIFGEDE